MQKAFPIIPCNLCGSQPNLQRQVIADMLRDWDKRYPGRIETMFSAMQNVVPSHLCDTNLFDFKGITHGSEVVNGGDLAFDREEIPLQPAGWQPEEDENQLDELRLNVVEVKYLDSARCASVSGYSYGGRIRRGQRHIRQSRRRCLLLHPAIQHFIILITAPGTFFL